MENTANTLFQLILYGLIAASSFWTAFQFAAGLFPLGSLSVRWNAAIILQCWILVAIFHLLAALLLFQLAAALVVLIFLSIGTSWIFRSHIRAAQIIREDLRRAGSHLKTLMSSPVCWVFVAVGVLVGVRFLRSLLAPPLGWDALTYHLPKATLWIQHGGYASLPGPGANTYYEYFRTGGDLLWAWTMISGPSDLLLGVTSLLLWCGLVLTFFVAIRLVQSDVSRAALAAVTVAVIPVILQYFSAFYVDILLLIYVISATMFLSHWLRTSSPSFAILSAASLGLAAATTFTALPMAIAGGGMIFFSRAATRRRLGILLSCFLLALVGAPDYIKTWIETGSPLYPFELKIDSQVFLAGNTHFLQLLSGQLHQNEATLCGSEYYQYLFFKSIDPHGQLNFGIGGLVLLLLAAWGTINCYRVRATRPTAILIIVFSVLGIVPMLFETAAIYHTKLWAPALGRLILPSFGLLMILSGSFGGRWFMPLWIAIALVNIALSLPKGLGEVDVRALTALFPWLVAGLLTAAIAMVIRRRIQLRWVTGFLVLVSVFIPFSQLGSVRSKFRYDYYQAAADFNEPVFEAHPLHSPNASAWPLWQYFDTDRPMKLAVAAGWDGLGHNWYWQPIFGSRLQNRLHYIPITGDGTLVNPNEQSEIARRADFPAWLGRIVEAKLDAVVLLYPDAIERVWVREHPSLFSPLITDTYDLHAAFRVDSAASIRFLQADTCIHRSYALTK